MRTRKPPPSEKARGPRFSRRRALARLLGINKIFKMAVREAERECAGQSARGAGSWRARAGGAEKAGRRGGAVSPAAARAGPRGASGGGITRPRSGLGGRSA